MAALEGCVGVVDGTWGEGVAWGVVVQPANTIAKESTVTVIAFLDRFEVMKL